MKKQPLSYREEMALLRRRIENTETKMDLIREPLLLDALAYELLGLRARMNYLFSLAREDVKTK